MKKEIKPLDHTNIAFNKIGVLLVNLGTPEGTDFFSVRKYLKEFLSDRRVIDLFKPFWWIILNLIILTFRPSKSGKAYKRIWNNKKGSPQRFITENQIKKLKNTYKNHSQIQIEFSMRYGNPSIKSKLNYLFYSGCTKILIFPLYPQYSASTTATVQDEVCKWLLKKRWQPSIRFVAPWYDDFQYIEAICNSIKKSNKNKSGALIISFHGVPKRYLISGDPYYCHCQKTGRLIQEKVKWPEEKFFITFQSRFGPEEWLQPYTDKTIIELGKKGIKHLSIISPGFVTDCLETLDEIKNEANELFIENGGRSLNYISCLNDSRDGISVLKNQISKNLSGWIDFN